MAKLSVILLCLAVCAQFLNVSRRQTDSRMDRIAVKTAQCIASRADAK